MYKKFLMLFLAFMISGAIFMSCSSDDDGGTTDPTPDPKLSITSPNGGEILQMGTSVMIYFDNDLTEAVSVDLYKAGELLQNIDVVTDTDSLAWTIPTLAIDTDYSIKVESTTDSTAFDFSDANFTIAPAGDYIIVTSSNGGDIWLKGSNHVITWYDNIAGAVSIELWKNSIWEATLYTGEASDGSRNWLISETLDAGADYSIKVISDDNTTVNDISNNFFCIAEDRDDQNIIGDWNIAIFKQPAVLNFAADGTWTDPSFSGTWEMVGNGIRWDIELPEIDSDAYGLGIVEGNEMVGTVVDPDGFPADWYAERVLRVTYPNGSEALDGDALYVLTWDDDLTEDVKIDLYENDVFLQTIESSTANDGTFNWLLPTDLTTSTKYKIRITRITSGVYDESDDSFTINGVTPTAFEDDDFEDGVADNWSAVIGNWSVIDSTYTLNCDSLTVNSTVYNLTITGNFVVEAKMKKISGGSWFYGIYINGDNSTLNSSGYWNNSVMVIILPDGRYGFWVMDNGLESGSWYTCPAVNTGLDAWNTLKVIVNNDTGDYHVYINNQYIQTHNNTTFTSGKLGLNFYDNSLLGVGAVDYVKISPINKSVIDNIDIKRVTELPHNNSGLLK